MPPLEISTRDALTLLGDLTAVIAHACTEIRKFSPGTVAQRLKPDKSPVTTADEISEATILDGLAQLLPGVPVISEESVHHSQATDLSTSFLIVDPLDGTREFIAGRDEFTVNLAIVTYGTPIAGIVAAPARNLIWRGVTGERAERLRLSADGADGAQAIHTRGWPAREAVAVVSRSHLDNATEGFLAALEPISRRASGSAIKFCEVAEGRADVYPRLATTCEWDVAAGHAIVVAAGGDVTKPQGNPLTYGHRTENFRVPAFIAWGDPHKAVSFKAQKPATR
jgi:3'(2'), 5'-bisphosphate nucleotidase